MYTRPIIYKVYSVIIFAFSIFSFLGSIATLFIPFDTLPDLGSLASVINTAAVIIKIGLLISALLTLFFAYTEFSSMFCFADMIDYEKSGAVFPFEKKNFVMSANVYRKFGTVIFYINSQYEIMHYCQKRYYYFQNSCYSFRNIYSFF